MSDCDTLDPRFTRPMIGHAKREGLWTGGGWTEGPVSAPAATVLLGSDRPDDRVMHLAETDGSLSVLGTRCGLNTHLPGR